MWSRRKNLYGVKVLQMKLCGRHRTQDIRLKQQKGITGKGKNRTEGEISMLASLPYLLLKKQTGLSISSHLQAVPQKQVPESRAINPLADQQLESVLIHKNLPKQTVMAMSQINVCLRNWNWELWYWWWWWLSKPKRHTERAHRATNKYYVQEEESKQPRGTTIAINQGKFYPEGTPGNFWRHFNYHNWEILGGGVLLASRGWRPGMILDILQCPGQPHNKG